MNKATRMAVITACMGLLAACSSPEYIISTNDGTLITTSGKPKLDEKTGMYTYKDAEGRATTIKKDEVKQIMQR